MTTINWNTALQGVTPQQGFQPLPPATYRFRIVSGEGRTAGSGAQMVSVSMEVLSGPKMGRKVFHNWVLPKEESDSAKQSMGFFLGAMEIFGLSPQWFGQTFGGQDITKEHCDYIAQTLVASGRSFKATASLQSKDPSRNNFNNFITDDGVEPEPPAEPKQNVFNPGAPPIPTGAPGGNLPLGGFPGSGGVGGAPVPGPPAWAGQPQPGQAPPAQPNQGQFAPAAQAQGMQQFGTTQQDQFPGQSFPGQVNPATFPPQGQQLNPQQIAAGQGGSAEYGAPPAQQFGGPVQGFQGQPDQNGQFQQQAQPVMQTQQPAPGPQQGVPAPMPGMPQPGQAPQGFQPPNGQPSY